MVLMFLGMGFHTKAQDSLLYQPEVLSMNVDSLIADSIKKAFILNHKPLKRNELDTFVIRKTKDAFGGLSSYYMRSNNVYPAFSPAKGMYLSRRNPSGREWVFYVFCFLYLVIGFQLSNNTSYLRNLFRVYFNYGFIFRQVRDQMLQAPLSSLVMNLLFLMSGGLFVYFGIGREGVFSGLGKWTIMLLTALLLLMVYLVKLMILNFMGWLLKQKPGFDDYAFIVFLNNKILGMVMLVSSSLMAFTGIGLSTAFFNFTLMMILAMILFRMFRAFQIFNKFAKMNIPGFFLVFISLEVIPSAILLKLFSEGVQLVVGMGWL